MKRPPLSVGDRCWMITDGIICVVDVAEVKTIFPGESDEFQMFQVKRYDDLGTGVICRTELWRCRDERGLFEKELMYQASKFREALDELMCQDANHIPEVGDDI